MRFKKFFMAMLTASLIAMSAAAPALAGTFIKDVKVIGGSKSEVNALKSSLTAQGWVVIDQDLNAKAGGDYIYLLYLPEDNSDGNNYGYISDFYISNSKDSPDSLTLDDRNYYRVSYDGGDNFVNSKGDLNSQAGGDYIYLYLTRDSFEDYRVVTGISFNTEQGGAIGVNGGSTGYDLNNKTKKKGDSIYMHLSTGKLVSKIITIGTRLAPATRPFYPGFALSSLFTQLNSSTFSTSLTQQLYKAFEIGTTGTITSIMFDCASDGPCSFSDVEIYMVQTHQSCYTMFAPDPVQYNVSDKVFEGTVSASGPGWLNIKLHSAFEYDGKSHLMVCCLAPAQPVSNEKLFWEFETDPIDPCTIYILSDVSNQFSVVSAIRNHIQLSIIPDYYSKPGNLSVSSITNQGAMVSWDGDSEATGYAYQYRRAGKTTWSQEQSVSVPSVKLKDLYAFDSYDFRVRAKYGNCFSNYVSVGFKTSLAGTAATVRGETKYVTTFYDRSAKYELPDGALAYTAAPDGNKMVFYQLDRVIPSGTAVIIISDNEDIPLTQTDASAKYNYPNILQGSDMPVSVSGGKVGGKTVYVFGIDKGKLGFYQFSGSEVPPGKAYYLAQ